MITSGTSSGFASHSFGVRAALYLLSLALSPGGCQGAAEPDRTYRQSGSRDVSKEQPYCLDLFSSRSEVLLGEPVRLIVSLTNCSSVTQTERNLLAPEYGLLSVWVQRPSTAKEELYSPAIRRDGRGKRATEIAPGEAIDAELPIYYGRDGWVLDREGVYSIRVEYPVGRDYIQSDSIEIRVSPGDDANQLAAAHAFMQPHASLFYFLTGGDEEGEYELEQIVKTYPDTVSASYSRLAIELNNVQSGESASRKASCQQLYDDTSSMLASIPDIVTASHGYQVLVQCLRDAGMDRNAESTKDKYYAQFPEASDLQALWIDGVKATDGG